MRGRRGMFASYLNSLKRNRLRYQWHYAFDSGKSVHKKTRISKAGNRHIRSALYMPALSAKQHDPHVKAYFQHLVDNGKLPLQALCAVMRKLLHAIHGMLKHDKPFDNTRFYAIPACG